MNGLGRKKDNEEKKQSVFTRETFGVVLILFATLSLVCLITRGSVFSLPGEWVNSFLFGCFGYFAFAVVLWCIIGGVRLVADKKPRVSLKQRALMTLGFILIATLTHIATMSGNELSYTDYLKTSYFMAVDGGIQTCSGGGMFIAFIAQPLSRLMTDVGCYVVLGVSFLVVCYFFLKNFANGSAKKEESSSNFRSSFVKSENISLTPSEEEKEPSYSTVNETNLEQASKQRLFITNPDSFGLKNKHEMKKDNQNSGIKIGFSEGGLGVVKISEEKPVPKVGEEYKKKLEYIKTPANLDIDALRENVRQSAVSANKYAKPTTNQNTFSVNNGTYTTVSDYVNKYSEPTDKKEEQENIPFIEHNDSVTLQGQDAKSRADKFEKLYVDNQEDEPVSSVVEENVFRPISEEKVAFNTIEENKNESKIEQDIPLVEETTDFNVFTEQVNEKKEENEEIRPSILRSEGRVGSIFGLEKQEKEEKKVEDENQTTAFTSRANADGNLGSRRGFNFGQTEKEQIKQEEPKVKKPAPPINRKYYRPPMDLLETYSQPVDVQQENHQERMDIIQKTLEEFHINAIPQSYVQGPAFTRYEIMMPAGVSVKKVLGFDDDLKMRLAAKDGVRIEAPIPGKNLVGVEVANNTKATVGFREVIEDLTKNPKKGALMFAVGKDIVGNAISYDLAKGPHYLIAGATGSGKSVCLHVMILSLLMRYSPEELKVVLVDPKGVEFRKYEHIPHLLVDEIITDSKRVLSLLKWAYEETTRRNDMFTEAGGEVSNIDDYNKYIASDTVPKLPRIVFFIDELADLMETCKKDLEQRIRMVAAKSRSAGIHLVLATQRPSVDVITGTIKANLPSRIALRVMNYADSSTILSEGGAEKLLGNGDMLLKDSSMGNYERYQGAYISGREITNVVNYIKEKNVAYFDEELYEYLENETNPKPEEMSYDGGEEGNDANEINEFFLKALWLAVNTQTVSISQLQRRFQIGYSRAGGLVDKMERMGFVSPNEGSKARKVLLTREEFENRFGAMPD
ncbi:MAG: DNA translocase FtsK [Clostridiales bacterium]|nr:DNA translocase FtsK [Clostridiales bacterium]